MKALRDAFLAMVSLEADRAAYKFPRFNSHHEAYAVILEEVHEYWDEVRKNESKRDRAAMLTELTQIAAMCVRAASELSMTANILPEKALDCPDCGHMLCWVVNPSAEDPRGRVWACTYPLCERSEFPEIPPPAGGQS
ncbi:MAG: hypothetical protein LC772_06810 [Chloroflexi bacterium]|nr:hypothetical protein [Chloroflexota bacterium]